MRQHVLKILLSVWLIAALWVAHEFASNGRYVYMPENGKTDKILDSRTGTIFELDTKSERMGVAETDIRTGHSDVHWLTIKK